MDLAQGVRLVSFFVLTAGTIAAALGVVLVPNLVYAAFLLGGVFASVAGLYVLLNADFLAAAQVLIYVGAVNVLILFAIMLVNRREAFPPTSRRWWRGSVAGLVSAGLFALLATVVVDTPWSLAPANVAPIPYPVVEIGKHFFSDYLLPFELASILLLMAMVGAIVLARRDVIPEGELPPGQTQQTVWRLRERPRELLPASKSAKEAER
ncbi:MAG: NADH-quinone oxidoreductase subunit J [Cyanobacteria bacterium QS_8_64_29]|nr:MAG: NADH-quinone oxidoreductase subunit J [Cyanobacteria bacterium QS_8_64_29]